MLLAVSPIKTTSMLLCLILLFFALSVPARAVLRAEFTYEEPVGVTNLHETIVVNALMRNTGTEPITTGYGGGFTSSFVGVYRFSESGLPPNDTNFTQQWLFINVLPGESYPFVFGKFIPPPGGAPAGNYAVYSNMFGVGGPVTERVDFNFRNQFSRTVVPEPSCPMLLSALWATVMAYHGTRRNLH